MVSINTNLSSLIVQNNLQKSTNVLNTAIERMTTGFKINGAKDNAAGYSISETMSSQISSYGVAQDNIASGMDMLTTAQDTISLLQTKGERLMSLWTQAQNGTYGASSLAAIQSEADSIVQEINRLYENSEYNGIKLLSYNLPDWAETVKSNAGLTSSIEVAHDGFIEDPYYRDGEGNRISDDTINTTLTHVSSVTSLMGFTSTTYAVSTVEDLVNLAALVNSGVNTENITFIMGDDIDLSEYCQANKDTGGWTPIGTWVSYSDVTKTFKGTFDGNGHKITGLYIGKNESTGEYQDNRGLFGATYSNATIKNLKVEGEVTGKKYAGGLLGESRSYQTKTTITNCSSDVTVKSTVNNAGGLVGGGVCTISNSYSTGSVTSEGDYAGGLAGSASSITNSYATGTVTGRNNVGGLVAQGGSVTNSYATGDVNGKYSVGGLVGMLNGTNDSITNCYATGSVLGVSTVGGLVGEVTNGNTILNSYATGDVTSSNNAGGLVGHCFDGKIKGCYSTGGVSGENYVGGLAGVFAMDSGGTTMELTDVYCLGNVNCVPSSTTGALVGQIMTDDNAVYSNLLTKSDDLEAVGTCGFMPNVQAKVESSMSLIDTMTNFQVGISGDSSSQISANTHFNSVLTSLDITSESTYNKINDFLNELSTRATELGAIYNRLDSALESTSTAIENLTSSRSTIRDADIATESSQYIKSQILQQAAATLLATANQSPSIALQLL